jgi:hypothetical protein
MTIETQGSNRTTTGQLQRAQHNWEVFDSLPRNVKEFIWYAPLSFTTGRRWISSVNEEEELRVLCAKGAEKIWGPSHPQSYTALYVPSAADLGF